MMVKKEAPMSDLGHPVFDTTVQKTNQVLKDIEQAYGWPKQRRQQSYDAPLPMLVRGLYYQGWKPARVPVKMDREEFLERIRRELDFEVEGGAELLVNRVCCALQRYVPAGEWDDILSSLPRDLAALLPS